jgi:hypothetical protein
MYRAESVETTGTISPQYPNEADVHNLHCCLYTPIPCDCAHCMNTNIASGSD